MRRRSFLGVAAAGAVGGIGGAAARTAAAAGPRLRIGQIGTGHSHAAGKMEAIRSLPDTYEVAGVAEADDALRAAAADAPAYRGLRWLDEAALLAAADVPLVAVETRMRDACAAAARAVRAGKHVHLDQPGGFDPGAFRAMRLDAERRGLTGQMGYMLRYNPAFELVFRAARAGWFGTITEIDCAMGKLAPAALRDEMKGFPGGGMVELACHLVDAVVTLLGAPAEVHAFSAPTRDDGVPDNQLAVLAYPRATATIRCNHADPFGGPRRFFAVAGTQGTAEISPLESGRLRLRLTEPREGRPAGESTAELAVPKSRYAAEFADLAEVVRGGRTLAWDAAHDVAVHAAALRAGGVRP
jgi:predicted dehydrogenase